MAASVSHPWFVCNVTTVGEKWIVLESSIVLHCPGLGLVFIMGSAARVYCWLWSRRGMKDYEGLFCMLEMANVVQ